MAQRKMIEFPEPDKLPGHKVAFLLSSMVALARSHWRMGNGNRDWPAAIRGTHFRIHDAIADRVETALAKYQETGREPDWARLANGLAEEMTTMAIKQTVDQVNMSAEAYIGAQLTLFALTGRLVDLQEL